MNKRTLRGFVTKTGPNEYTAIASTNAVDRYGEVVDQNGWMIDSYMKNPVMLWAHDSSSLPVARCLSIDLATPGVMVHKFEMADETMTPMQPYIKNSYDAGFLNAFSVGFIAHEMNGSVITKAELLEISFVPIPANQEALRLNGYDLGNYKSLDFGPIKGDIQKAVEELVKNKKISKKSEVSDELDTIEARQEKWQKINEIDEVFGAFLTVYLDETTPVEDFSKLLLEAIELLKEVASTDGADDDEGNEGMKAAFAEKIKVFMGGREKSGKTLSKKTKALIEKAMDHMADAIDCHKDMGDSHELAVSTLGELLESASTSQDGGASDDDDGDGDEKGVTKDALQNIRKALNITNHQSSLATKMVKDAIAQFASTR